MPATYEPIATSQVTLSTTSQVTFSSIPQTYTDLRIIGVSGQQTAGSIGIRLNSNVSSVYSATRLRGNGTDAASGRNSESQWRTYLNSAGNTINVLSDVNIFNYTNTSTFKTAFFNEYKGTDLVLTVALFRSTSAITNISLNAESDYFVAGSRFTLYGIKAA
jgi:hypothetical protein